MEYLEYTTKDGDRWDTLAAKYYGKASEVKPIADANKGVPLSTSLAPGIKLKIPILEAANLDTNLLPPWKR